MIYADTDFFLALLKDPDWSKAPARRLYRKHKRDIWASEITLIELLLLAAEYNLDPERLLVDVTELVQVRGSTQPYFVAAR